MPWCPKCNAEYVCGITVCSDCDYALTEQRYTEPEENPNAPALLTIAQNEYEAQAVKAFLESERIPVLFEYAGMAMTVIMGTSMEEVKILVPKSCLSRARALLESAAPAIGSELLDEAEPDPQADIEEEQSDLLEGNDLGTGLGITAQLVILLVLVGFFVYFLLRII